MQNEKEQLATQLLAIKGMVSELPEEQRNKVKEISDSFRKFLKENPTEATLAFGLIGAELSIQSYE